MSLVTQVMLAEKYGPLLTVQNVAEVLHIEVRTVQNQHSAETLGFRGVKRGQALLFHVADVADYIDALRQAA